jgi:hypothetical protein
MCQRQPRGYHGTLLLLHQAVGEDDLDDRWDRLLAAPVALQFAGERGDRVADRGIVR